MMDDDLFTSFDLTDCQDARGTWKWDKSLPTRANFRALRVRPSQSSLLSQNEDRINTTSQSHATWNLGLLKRNSNISTFVGIWISLQRKEIKRWSPRPRAWYQSSSSIAIVSQRPLAPEIQNQLIQKLNQERVNVSGTLDSLRSPSSLSPSRRPSCGGARRCSSSPRAQAAACRTGSPRHQCSPPRSCHRASTRHRSCQSSRP